MRSYADTHGRDMARLEQMERACTRAFHFLRRLPVQGSEPIQYTDKLRREVRYVRNVLERALRDGE